MTKGTLISILNALELSIKTQPLLTASGASFLLVSPPAEASTIFTSLKLSGVASSTI
jgi:hypothetical protein